VSGDVGQAIRNQLRMAQERAWAAEARADRLAEALREIAELGYETRWNAEKQVARAALAADEART
jgi:hypothetical protein